MSLLRMSLVQQVFHDTVDRVQPFLADMSKYPIEEGAGESVWRKLHPTSPFTLQAW